VGAQTLDRGLALLDVLAGAPGGLTVAQLAAALGVHRAVVYRLLGPLAARSLVARDADGRQRLGPGLAALAARVAPDLQAAARPELAALADELGATAFLTVADGDEAVALLALPPRHAPIHLAYRPGFRHPLDVGASGRAILAGRPPAPGEPAAVRRARRAGWATSRGEIQPGATGVAAPVAGADASVGVVRVGPVDEAAAGPRVRAAARAVAAALGRA
jgi:DNA-binding IclR family transcriptional regulator